MSRRNASGDSVAVSRRLPLMSAAKSAQACPELEMADLLAREAMKELDRTLTGARPEARRSYHELRDAPIDGTRKFIFQNRDREYCERWRDVVTSRSCWRFERSSHERARPNSSRPGSRVSSTSMSDESSCPHRCSEPSSSPISRSSLIESLSFGSYLLTCHSRRGHRSTHARRD
jgi:hypothetical protein